MKTTEDYLKIILAKHNLGCLSTKTIYDYGHRPDKFDQEEIEAYQQAHQILKVRHQIEKLKASGLGDYL